MRAGGRHGAQQALSRVSQMTEPPSRCEGPSPEQPKGLCPERRAAEGLALPSPGCPCSLLSVRVQTSLGNGGLGTLEDGTPR